MIDDLLANGTSETLSTSFSGRLRCQFAILWKLANLSVISGLVGVHVKSLFSALVAVASVVLVSGCKPASRSFYAVGRDPLDGITVPSNWRLISDYERYDKARGSAVTLKVRMPSVDECVENITNHAKIDQNGNWIGESSCFERLITYQGNPAANKLLSETLLELVKRDEIKHSREKDVHYTYFESVMFLTLLYAAEKPRLELTVAQAEKIEDWLLKRVSVRLVVGSS